MKKIISVFLALVLICFCFAGCGNPAMNATYNVKTEAESFQLYRKMTAINLRTDKVLFEIEGFFNYENEEDGDLSIVMEVGKNEYTRHVVHITEGTTFVVEQLDPSNFSPYEHKIRIYAAYPDISFGATVD